MHTLQCVLLTCCQCIPVFFQLSSIMLSLRIPSGAHVFYCGQPLVVPAAELIRQSRLLGMRRSAVRPTGLLSVLSWLPPAQLPHECAEIPQSSSCTSTALILATLVHQTASFQINDIVPRP